MLIEVFYLLIIFIWKTETCCVRNVADGSTSLCYSVDNSCEVFVVSTACILCIELYVFNILLCILYCCYGTLNDFLTVRVELILDMRIRSSDTCVDTLALSIF